MATSIARQHHHLSAMTESEPQATPRTQYRDRRTETHHQQAQHFRCGRAGRKQTFGPNALHPPTPATAARDRWPFAHALLAEYTHTLNEQCAGCPATAAPSRHRLQATAPSFEICPGESCQQRDCKLLCHFCAFCTSLSLCVCVCGTEDPRLCHVSS
jgi:hypothetical protein